MKLRKIIAAVLAAAVTGGTIPSGAPISTAVAADYTKAVSGKLIFNVYSDHAELAACLTSASGEIVIPEEINGVTVTGIRGDQLGGAFLDCVSVTSVVIPDSVTSIGVYAFENCTSLASVTLSGSVSSVGTAAFAGCTSLAAIKVDSSNPYFTEQDGVLLNKDMTSIVCYPTGKPTSSYTVPDTVTSIGWNTFESCTNLVSVTIPDSVTSIGGMAFYGCEKLASVQISDSVMSIGEDAFNKCVSLKTIDLPDNLTKIGKYLFRGCSGLEQLDIPDSVTALCGHVRGRGTG